MDNLIKRCRNTNKESYDNTTGNGSYNSDITFFDDVSFGLQFDRKGNEGFVIDACGVKLSSSEFQDTILPTINDFTYKFVNGGMTDVMALKEIGVTCPLANVECGYYNPHSDESYVVIQDVEIALELGLLLAIEYGDVAFTPQNSEARKTYDRYDWYTPDTITSNRKTSIYCVDCYKPVEFITNEEELCDECYDYYYSETLKD